LTAVVAALHSLSALGQKQTYAAQQVMSALPPNSDRKSGFPHKVMSALPPKADMCGAAKDVCFGHKRTFAASRFRVAFAAAMRVGVVNGNADKPKVKHDYQELRYGQSRTTESDERAGVRLRASPADYCPSTRWHKH